MELTKDSSAVGSYSAALRVVDDAEVVIAEVYLGFFMTTPRRREPPPHGVDASFESPVAELCAESLEPLPESLPNAW